MFFIINGNAEISINDEVLPLKSDSVFYCRGGSEYNIRASEKLSIIALNFDLTQEKNSITSVIPLKSANSGTKKIPVIFTPVSDSDILNSYILIPDGSHLRHKFEKIISEFSECKILYHDMCSGLLKEILIALHRNEPGKSSAVNDVISYIRQNFRKDITNKELAVLAGYHEYHLNKLFIKHTGTTMHNYILNARINEAKRLILNSGMTLDEIASQTGFNNYTYFSTYFKQTVGLTPLKYRKSLKNRI